MRGRLIASPAAVPRVLADGSALFKTHAFQTAPKHALQTRFETQMLRDLEAARGDLGVTSYGLSVTTLEEVFLSLAEMGESPGGAGLEEAGGGGGEQGAQAGATPSSAAVEGDEDGSAGGGGGDLEAPLLPKGGGGGAAGSGGGARLAGWRLYGQQLRALTIKRALCARWAGARTRIRTWCMNGGMSHAYHSTRALAPRPGSNTCPDVAPRAFEIKPPLTAGATG